MWLTPLLLALGALLAAGCAVDRALTARFAAALATAALADARAAALQEVAVRARQLESVRTLAGGVQRCNFDDVDAAGFTVVDWLFATSRERILRAARERQEIYNERCYVRPIRLF